MLSGSDDGFGGGLSCPEKDRCTSVDNHFTRQYNPEDSSERHYTELLYYNVLCSFSVFLSTSMG
jgi:hypothetical protein